MYRVCDKRGTFLKISPRYLDKKKIPRYLIAQEAVDLFEKHPEGRVHMETENELGRLILKLANTIIKNRNRHLQALDLTAAQADSLQFFLSHDNATATDLKDAFGIAHQSARGIVSRMAEKGCVTLKKSELDGRCQLVTPTEYGRELGERMMKNRLRTAGKLLDGMTDEEQEGFIRCLHQAFENVKND
jgi:DNA-binding MarR family transcriptional regulator